MGGRGSYSKSSNVLGGGVTKELSTLSSVLGDAKYAPDTSGSADYDQLVSFSGNHTDTEVLYIRSQDGVVSAFGSAPNVEFRLTRQAARRVAGSSEFEHKEIVVDLRVDHARMLGFAVPDMAESGGSIVAVSRLKRSKR